MSIQLNACLLLAGLSAFVAVPRQGQSAPTRPQGHDAAPTQLSLVDLSGADVVLEASPAEKAGNAPAATPDSPKGKVVDVVLSTNDGQIACAAISVGKLLGADDRTVLVPSTVLQCTTVEKKPAYVLRMTKAEIQSLPEFDIRKDGTDGLDRAVERARGLSSEASAGKRKDPSDTGNKKPSKAGPAGEPASQAPSLTAAPMHVLASQLSECGLSASDTEFGRVHDAVVDVRGNTVGYLLVSRAAAASVGTSLCVVPLRACRWSRDSGKVSLRLEKTSDQLKTAPEYKKPDQGLVSPDQMKGADALFGSVRAGSGNPQ